MGSVDIYPPSQPSGMALAYAEVTASQTGISTETDLTGLTATVTVPAGRRIRITGQIQVQSATTSGTVLLRAKEGATVLQTSQENYNTIGGNGKYLSVTSIILPTAGSHTYKFSLQGTAGTVDLTPGATNPAFILVEDVTGTIYPAGTLVTAGLIASEQWINFTPTLTQSATVTNTVQYARYSKMGRIITLNVYLSVTGSGTGANPVVVGLPVPAAFTAFPLTIGTGQIFDQSAAINYAGILRISGSQTASFVPGAQTAANGLLGNATFTAGLTNLDEISYSGTYEAVS